MPPTGCSAPAATPLLNSLVACAASGNASAITVTWSPPALLNAHMRTVAVRPIPVSACVYCPAAPAASPALAWTLRPLALLTCAALTRPRQPSLLTAGGFVGDGI